MPICSADATIPITAAYLPTMPASAVERSEHGDKDVAGEVHNAVSVPHFTPEPGDSSMDFAKAAAGQFPAMTAGSATAGPFDADHCKQIFCIGSMSSGWESGLLLPASRLSMMAR
jgi:hypothetical protein